MNDRIMTPEAVCDLVCAALSAAFQGVSENPLTIKASAGSDLDVSKVPIGFRCSVTGAVEGSIHFLIEPESAVALASILVGIPPEENATLESAHEEAIFEILNQVAAEVSSGLSARCGNCAISVLRNDAAPADPAICYVLREDDERSRVSINLLISETLVTAFANCKPAEGAPSNSHGKETPSVLRPGTSQQNLELLLDVGLELTLRFGQRSMTLGEIADLTSGSVLELDHEVDDPVELLLGDRVIAKGEVVIVDGNYGLRVTQIMPVAQPN